MRGTPFESGAPARYPTDMYTSAEYTYRFHACVTWWRMLSSAAYWDDPFGERNQDAHTTCRDVDATSDRSAS
jgi:hypothetical protein